MLRIAICLVPELETNPEAAAAAAKSGLRRIGPLLRKPNLFGSLCVIECVNLEISEPTIVGNCGG